ncbi:MAG TPA: radical SAM protein [Holophagaceae bacterium]|nr:radical SAM protein [Holophagaceae bacterium]
MSGDLVKAHLDHRRVWADFDYCYPVISRRSKGVSLGVNLNPDKVCNFDCVYCEVDRVTPAKRKDIDLDQLEREMAALLDLTLDGTLFEVSPFDSARPEQRRLNDIAFSGDGEPTTAPEFAEAVDRIAKLKWARGLHDVKLVLITDSSRLQAREVIQGLDTLQANHGEIWAKLDAGTEEHYKRVNRSAIPFQRILDNLEITARLRPLLIQTLFFSWQGQGPSEAEVDAYIGRLRHILNWGGKLTGIQLYTVARPTPEPEARPLRGAELEAVAARIRAGLPEVPLEVFPGPEDWPEENQHEA